MDAGRGGPWERGNMMEVGGGEIGGRRRHLATQFLLWGYQEI